MSTHARTLPSVRLIVFLSLATLFGGTLPSVAAVTPQDGLSALEATQAGFRAVHAKIAPAVVTISSTLRVPARSSSSMEDFFGLTPPQSSRVASVSGSGVIIRKEGIVLTNSHVVEGATNITVTMVDSKEELPAEVVQTDPRTDLAIVRITKAGTYPTAPLGDAAKVQVGDWAIAFGSPYDLPSTMTVGVISATGRKLGDQTGDFNYYDLLQTDASINHGNSGGPLVNTRGEVVGINFMIFSPGEESGSIGIGFAIPVNDYTKRIIDTLISGKRVERGRIGIYVDALSDTMREQFGVPAGGVLVQSVMPGMAGAKAGLQDEDIITEFNGEKITDPDQFINLVERTQPGSRVQLTVVRDKKTQTITVTLGADTATNTATKPEDTVNEQQVGLMVRTLTTDIARQLNLTFTEGVVVTNVLQGSPAAQIGLRPGLVIVRVGQTMVKTEEEFWTALRKNVALSKAGVLLRIRTPDGGRTLTLPPVKPDEKK